MAYRGSHWSSSLPLDFFLVGLGFGCVVDWMTGSLGICLGFHRLLTHTGLVVPKWLSPQFLHSLVLFAGEGGPLSWCANHRKHHAFSDQVGDPHSPNDGPWWAHMFWLAFSTDGGDSQAYFKKWVPDLMKDPYLVFLEKAFCRSTLPLELP